MLVAPQCDAGLLERIKEELAGVEACFAASLVSDLPCVNSLVDHVEAYRGKMLRPLLVLTSGMAIDPDHSPTISHRVLGAVVEMVHMATLVHDDVLDEADTRRGGDTVNRLHGNETAVMLGDYLVSHAFELVAGLDRPELMHAMTSTTNTVCEGELLQLANRNNWQLDEGTYFEIIRRKTASLCGACCRLGAVLSRADDATADRMYVYGEQLGLAFQIVDDLLDLTGSEQTVGKTLGRDLDKGKMTLPLIHCLNSSPGPTRDELVALLEQRAVGGVQGNGERTSRFIQMMNETGSIAYAKTRASGFVDNAKEALIGNPGSAAKKLLHDVAETVLSRNF